VEAHLAKVSPADVGSFVPQQLRQRQPLSFHSISVNNGLELIMQLS
jgi:hypothetical protein